MELLERTQRRTLRYCVGLKQTTPTNIIYAETGISPIWHRFMFLMSKFIFRSFALRKNVLIEKVYDLQTALSNNNRYNLFDRFLPYIAFRIAKNYKHKIASFTKIPLYLFSYKTSIFTPKTEITSHSMTENIRHARFPQLVFQTSLFQLENRHLIFTDASKEESGVYVKIGFFSPTLQAHKIYRTDSNSSVFSGECIAIIHAVEYIFKNSV